MTHEQYDNLLKASIKRYWEQGRDTKDIADLIGLPEWEIEKLLAAVKREGRRHEAHR